MQITLTPEACINGMCECLEKMQKIEKAYSIARATPKNVKRQEEAMVAVLKAGSDKKTGTAKEEEVKASPEYEKIKTDLFLDEANAYAKIAEMDRLKLQHATYQSTLSYLREFQLKTI